LNWNNTSINSILVGTIYGKWLKNDIFYNVNSVKYNDKYIFCVTHDNHTKIIVLDNNKKWLCGKYLIGEINTLCEKSIINAYLTAQANVSQQTNYNIKDIKYTMKHIPKYIPSRININNSRKIPNNICQSHETSLLPIKMIESAYTWINNNPTYNYYFYDNRDRVLFLKKHFDDRVLQAYYKLTHGAFRADLFRACFIYIKGGVYSDIDQVCLKGLHTIISNDDNLVTGITRNTPHQSLLISAPNNPIFKHLITTGVERVFANKPLLGPWAGRGAGFFGPPAYTYSWIWFHNNKNNPVTDNEAKWLFNNKIKRGQYNIDNITINVKDSSLFIDDMSGGGKNSIASIKYDGYIEDTKQMNLEWWGHSR